MKKKICSIFILLVSAATGFAQVATLPLKIKSPNGNLTLTFNLKDGSPYYSLTRKNITVVKESKLGFILKGTTPLNNNFELENTSENEINETWTPVWGEEKTINNHAKTLKVQLLQKSKSGKKINIIFHLFNDGLGFRYEFPTQAHLKHFVVEKELTEFNFGSNHEAFWIPGDYDSNEYLYTKSKLSDVDAWKTKILSYGTLEENIPDQNAVQTPLMLKADNGLYINIHEAALVNYPSMQLHVDKENFNLSANLVPDAAGNMAYLRTPAKTPWRTIIVSDKATDILASKMILNLNEPSKIQNTSWIKPIKYIGVWWEMQTGKGAWNYTNNLDTLDANGKLIPNGHHSANTKKVKKYIDFAAKHGINSVLVEGWNTGWEEWVGIRNEESFDYVSPYPDFDVKEIQAYAAAKGVEMMMHNETGGSAINYDRSLDTAYKFMNQFGYTSVKTGYVGSIIPTKEHHDGQWMINHYTRVAEKAAKHKVMVNMHESVRPTGLHRTYPNWVANEAGRGNEWNAFTFGSPPAHETILPFTRLIGGPMDYTPGIFKMKNYAPQDPGRQMHSTLAKQLALYVTMFSPLQMAADLPENYEAHLDAFQFIKDVALDWDQSIYVEAEPAAYITVARKAKNTENWFVGAITNEMGREAKVSLAFLNKDQKYLATIYKDSKTADWKNNPEDYQIEQFIVSQKNQLNVVLAMGGGMAVSLKPVTSTTAIKGIKTLKK